MRTMQWWPRSESNRDGQARSILSRLRLPVPPRGLECTAQTACRASLGAGTIPQTFMKFCPACGQPVEMRIPPGDNLPRAVCTACGSDSLRESAHRGRLRARVAGSHPAVPARHRAAARLLDHAGRLHGERRDAAGAAPRASRWRRPRHGSRSARCCRSPTCCTHAQVHVNFRARLLDGKFGVGAESLQVGLYEEADIPWDEIAFPEHRVRAAQLFRGPARRTRAIALSAISSGRCTKTTTGRPLSARVGFGTIRRPALRHRSTQ